MTAPTTVRPDGAGAVATAVVKVTECRPTMGWHGEASVRSVQLLHTTLVRKPLPTPVRKVKKPLRLKGIFQSGGEGDRTPDLLNAIRVQTALEDSPND